MSGNLVHTIKDVLFPDRMLLWAIMAGFAIRIAVAPWTSWTYDTYPFYQGIVDQLAGLGPYGHMVYSYPPAFNFIEYPFSIILALFSDPTQWVTFVPSMVEVGRVTNMVVPTVTSPGFNLTYKLPLILADYLCGVLLYRFVRKIKDEDSGRRVFILWFLNPFVIFVSSIYGNFDVLAVFLTLLALYAMYSRRYLSAGLAVGLGVSMKLYPLYLGLFCFAYLVGQVIVNYRTRDDPMGRLKNPIKFIAGAIGGASSIVISVLLNPSLMVFINGRMSNNDMGGINIWGLLRTGNVLFNGSSALPQDEFTLVNTVTSYLMFLILFLILLRVFMMLRSSHERHEEQMIFGSMSVFVVLLLFQPVTHAHYLLWALPFLLLCSLYQHRFEHIVFALSVVGVVFWLALQSYMAFLYPLSVYTGAVPTDLINQVVVDYYAGSMGISAEGARIIPTVIGVGALAFALLPEKLDPAKRLMIFLRGRSHEE
ncbi:MAG: hypothetical protein A4E31_01371 [Methanomassiliicoccales archaeon PtaU1.Bin030]|nr:MAG: hypothetical protein A4E31_01371 [Methanomassiliicoccales archaeon PtaU1.Bin030]